MFCIKRKEREETNKFDIQMRSKGGIEGDRE